MGKKKKIEAKLSDQELVSSTIGYLEENKQGPFGLILLFSIFIGVAIFLPEITDYVNKLLGRDIVDTPVIVNNDDNNENDNSKDTKDTIHDLNESLAYTYNGLSFSNFKLSSDNTLTLNVKNTSDKDILNTEEKYFIEIYDINSTMLGRHIFETTKFIKDKESTYNFILTNSEYNNAAKILIVVKNIKDYPDYELDGNTLTCNKSGNTLEYTFNSDKIVSIKDTLELLNDNSEKYNQALLKYSKIASNYDNIEGVSSNLVEVTTGFTMTTSINLEKANIDNLKNNNYYLEDTSVKTIKFEMETRGYSCK